MKQGFLRLLRTLGDSVESGAGRVQSRWLRTEVLMSKVTEFHPRFLSGTTPQGGLPLGVQDLAVLLGYQRRFIATAKLIGPPTSHLDSSLCCFLANEHIPEKKTNCSLISRSIDVKEIEVCNFKGCVVSGDGSVPKLNTSHEDWVNMVNELQMGALFTRLGIPLIHGIDVHGHNTR
ncbi:hypothetical protein Ahy_B01g056225 isoform L [Arachis hypogaea]|nr:hypothetical protein Ahy_B01g056225 isoform L [Arachis hypogaea]